MTTVDIITTMLVGTMADRPDPSRQLMLYLDVDTKTPYVCDGVAWHPIGGGGSVSDATPTTPGVLLTDVAPSGAHPVALTRDGLPGLVSDGLGAHGFVVDGDFTVNGPNGLKVAQGAQFAAGIGIGTTDLASDGGTTITLAQTSNGLVVSGAGLGTFLSIAPWGDVTITGGAPGTALALGMVGSTVYIGGDVEMIGAVRLDGGLGLFNASPQAAPSSITGALSAVTDANAKAVLTSIIAALTADGGATNSTT